MITAARLPWIYPWYGIGAAVASGDAASVYEMVAGCHSRPRNFLHGAWTHVAAPFLQNVPEGDQRGVLRLSLEQLRHSFDASLCRWAPKRRFGTTHRRALPARQHYHKFGKETMKRPAVATSGEGKTGLGRERGAYCRRMRHLDPRYDRCARPRGSESEPSRPSIASADDA